jgi:hypothetical protein
LSRARQAFRIAFARELDRESRAQDHERQHSLV